MSPYVQPSYHTLSALLTRTSTKTYTSRLLNLPDEILSTILTNVTKPTKPEFTREPDGSAWENYETETTIAFLEAVCLKFARLVRTEHFSRHAHRVVLRNQNYLVRPLDADASALLEDVGVATDCAEIDKMSRACTFVENDFFFDNVRDLVIDPIITEPMHIDPMAMKIRQIVMKCDAISTITIMLHRIDEQCLLGVKFHLEHLIDDVTAKRGMELEVWLSGTPIVHQTTQTGLPF